MTTCKDFSFGPETFETERGSSIVTSVVIHCPKHAKMIEEYPDKDAALTLTARECDRQESVIQSLKRQSSVAWGEMVKVKAKLADSQADVDQLKEESVLLKGGVVASGDQILDITAEVQRLEAECRMRINMRDCEPMTQDTVDAIHRIAKKVYGAEAEGKIERDTRILKKVAALQLHRLRLEVADLKTLLRDAKRKGYKP